MAEDLGKAKGELESCKNANKSLIKQLADSTASVTKLTNRNTQYEIQLSDCKTKLLESHAEIKQLKTELEVARAAAGPHMDVEDKQEMQAVRKIAVEKAVLESRYSQLESDKKECERKFWGERSEKEKITKELEKTRKQVEETNRELEETRKELQDVKTDAESAMAVDRIVEERANKCEIDLADSKRKVADLETKLKHYEKTDEKLVNAAAEKGSLQAQLRHTANLVASLTAEVEKLRTNVNQSEAFPDQVRIALTGAEAKHTNNKDLDDLLTKITKHAIFNKDHNTGKTGDFQTKAAQWDKVAKTFGVGSADELRDAKENCELAKRLLKALVTVVTLDRAHLSPFQFALKTAEITGDETVANMLRFRAAEYSVASWDWIMEKIRESSLGSEMTLQLIHSSLGSATTFLTLDAFMQSLVSSGSIADNVYQRYKTNPDTFDLADYIAKSGERKVGTEDEKNEMDDEAIDDGGVNAMETLDEENSVLTAWKIVKSLHDQKMRNPENETTWGLWKACRDYTEKHALDSAGRAAVAPWDDMKRAAEEFMDRRYLTDVRKRDQFARDAIEYARERPGTHAPVLDNSIYDWALRVKREMDRKGENVKEVELSKLNEWIEAYKKALRDSEEAQLVAKLARYRLKKYRMLATVLERHRYLGFQLYASAIAAVRAASVEAREANSISDWKAVSTRVVFDGTFRQWVYNALASDNKVHEMKAADIVNHIAARSTDQMGNNTLRVPASVLEAVTYVIGRVKAVDDEVGKTQILLIYYKFAESSQDRWNEIMELYRNRLEQVAREPELMEDSIDGTQGTRIEMLKIYKKLLEEATDAESFQKNLDVLEGDGIHHLDQLLLQGDDDFAGSDKIDRVISKFVDDTENSRDVYKRWLMDASDVKSWLDRDVSAVTVQNLWTVYTVAKRHLDVARDQVDAVNSGIREIHQHRMDLAEYRARVLDLAESWIEDKVGNDDDDQARRAIAPYLDAFRKYIAQSMHQLLDGAPLPEEVKTMEIDVPVVDPVEWLEKMDKAWKASGVTFEFKEPSMAVYQARVKQAGLDTDNRRLSDDLTSAKNRAKTMQNERDIQREREKDALRTNAKLIAAIETGTEFEQGYAAGQKVINTMRVLFHAIREADKKTIDSSAAVDAVEIDSRSIVDRARSFVADYQRKQEDLAAKIRETIKDGIKKLEDLKELMKKEKLLEKCEGEKEKLRQLLVRWGQWAMKVQIFVGSEVARSSVRDKLERRVLEAAQERRNKAAVEADTKASDADNDLTTRTDEELEKVVSNFKLGVLDQSTARDAWDVFVRLYKEYAV